MIDLVIGSDHRGYSLKKTLLKFFSAVDIGTFSEIKCDYPDIAAEMSKKIKDFGVLICHSGIGMCIAANRFKNLRAALCFNNEMAILSREHNDCNVLVIGSKFVSENVAIEMINFFLHTFFDSKHAERVKKLSYLT